MRQLNIGMSRKGLDFMRTVRLGALLAASLALLASSPSAGADEVRVAVAANFLIPLRSLSTAFEAGTDHRVRISSGSTGQLYAQIVNGAPFDVLLAADQERPRLLTEAGIAEPESEFTYAIGRLALWSRDADLIGDDTLRSLASLEFRYLAIAAPELAPYGRAARQTLEGLGVYAGVSDRIVEGLNIAQAFSYVESRNAELGLVALSQVLAYEGTGSYRIVPAGLHAPIRQDAVLLRHGLDNVAARSFLQFLRSAAAARIIETSGYALPASDLTKAPRRGP